ncbi:MAG: hypothetical protein JSW47_14120 [Phycisphaerales bacterium]|nr:MAG: hypothetical protein JSW47_14120 [Phycisphaerales bacterium]UCF16834.1 MAG: hypothetical protein JSW59_05105 [Phycisphaerales bacterium]
MKRKTKIVIISVVTSVIFLLVWFASDRIRLRLLVGAARILRDAVAVQLSVDGASVGNVRCFREDTVFDGGKSNRLVLWVEIPKASYGRDILIVDPDSRKIYLPNASSNDYKLLWKRWLMQSDSGAMGAAFGDSKPDPDDPNFQQADNIISFTIPPILDLPSGRWELKLN